MSVYLHSATCCSYVLVVEVHLFQDGNAGFTREKNGGDIQAE